MVDDTVSSAPEAVGSKGGEPGGSVLEGTSGDEVSDSAEGAAGDIVRDVGHVTAIKFNGG